MQDLKLAHDERLYLSVIIVLPIRDGCSHRKNVGSNIRLIVITMSVCYLFEFKLEQSVNQREISAAAI